MDYNVVLEHWKESHMLFEKLNAHILTTIGSMVLCDPIFLSLPTNDDSMNVFVTFFSSSFHKENHQRKPSHLIFISIQNWNGMQLFFLPESDRVC